MCGLFDVIVKPESKVRVQILVKGLGVTLKSHGPPTPPTTFNHEGVL